MHMGAGTMTLGVTQRWLRSLVGWAWNGHLEGKDAMQATPQPTGPTGDFASYSDTVLYDVYFEAATQLRAHLVRLERAAVAAADDEQAARWRARRFAVADERDNVDATDRAAQIAALTRWRSEMGRLTAQHTA